MFHAQTTQNYNSTTIQQETQILIPYHPQKQDVQQSNLSVQADNLFALAFIAAQQTIKELEDGNSFYFEYKANCAK